MRGGGTQRVYREQTTCAVLKTKSSSSDVTPYDVLMD